MNNKEKIATTLTLEIAKEKGWPPNIQAAFKRMSPASRYLGLEILDVDMKSLTVEVAFNASDELCNMWGGIQGGMVAAMLDDVMSFAVGLDLDWGQISPTLELKVSMLAPARPGRIYATGRVIKRGRSVGFIEGELKDADGGLLATSSSTATFVTLKKKD
ncbi:MAG: PaaI family thioesterase [Parvibaculum sp.]